MRVALIRKKILHQIIMKLKIMVHLICHMIAPQEALDMLSLLF